MAIQVQEAFRMSNRSGEKRISLEHTIVKISRMQNKKRILKIAGEMCHIICKGINIRITDDFSIFHVLQNTSSSERS
jgi:hypothetical protein